MLGFMCSLAEMHHLVYALFPSYFFRSNVTKCFCSKTHDLILFCSSFFNELKCLISCLADTLFNKNSNNEVIHNYGK